MNCEIMIIEKAQINKLKPLWEKLNKIHLNNSYYFKDNYRGFTFKKRCEKFNKLDDNKIQIQLIVNGNTPVGYCISTIENNIGEINSIFIENEYTGFGYGGQLVENSIKWLKENNCVRVMVAVAEGHESVFDFYRKYDFYPRATYLQLKE